MSNLIAVIGRSSQQGTKLLLHLLILPVVLFTEVTEAERWLQRRVLACKFRKPEGWVCWRIQKRIEKAHKMQEKHIEKAFLCPWSRLTGQTRERSHGARGTSDVPRYGREDFRGAQRSRNITRPPDSFDFFSRKLLRRILFKELLPNSTYRSAFGSGFKLYTGRFRLWSRKRTRTR